MNFILWLSSTLILIMVYTAAVDLSLNYGEFRNIPFAFISGVLAVLGIFLFLDQYYVGALIGVGGSLLFPFRTDVLTPKFITKRPLISQTLLVVIAVVIMYIKYKYI